MHISQEYPEFGKNANLRTCLTVCFSKHESPFTVGPWPGGLGLKLKMLFFGAVFRWDGGFPGLKNDPNILFKKSHKGLN